MTFRSVDAFSSMTLAISLAFSIETISRVPVKSYTSIVGIGVVMCDGVGCCSCVGVVSVRDGVNWEGG